MCNQSVMQKVNERVKAAGAPPTVSRRHFFKMGGALAAGAALLPRLTQAQSAQTVIDLSHTLSADFPVYPGAPQAGREVLFSHAEHGFYSQVWNFNEHSGTHIDFPAHFIADGMTVDRLPVEGLVGPAVVVDIAARAEEDADALLTVADLQAWESANGGIPEGAFVMMYSGWEERLGTPAFSGDETGLHFPGFSPEAAKWLVSERAINGIGVDTMSMDHGISATFDTHFVVLGAGLIGIENLANLKALRGHSATVVCGIPKYEAGSGGPARILALA